MNLLQKLLIGLGAIAICLLTHYLWPAKPKETVRTVVQEHTVTRIVKQKDGTIITVIDSTVTKDKSKQLPQNRPNWHVSVAAVPTLQAHGVKLDYQLHLNRRILGPVYAGLMLSTKQEAGLILALEF